MAIEGKDGAAPGELLLTRRVSSRSFAVAHLAAIALGAALLWASVRWESYRLALAIASLVPIAVSLGRAGLARMSAEYRVYTDSLEVERGILSRRIENIQLFRVRDLGLSQSLLGRLLGYGDVVVTSTDQSAPRFSLCGVDQPRALYERLRELVARSQAIRRTMIVEEEEPSGES